MINNPLSVPIRLRATLDTASARSAMRQLQDLLSRGINISDTILGAANPNTHWRTRGAGYQSLAYMDRAIMGRGGMPGMLGRLGAGMLGFGGGVNSLPAMAVQAVETARNQEQAYSDLNRRVGESIQTYARFREEVIATGREIGLTRQQILSLTDAYVSGVGKMSTATMSNNLRGAMNLGKGMGIDPSGLVGAMTSAQRAGVVPVGGSTQPIMAAIATAVTMGGMGGRESEVVKAIEDLTQMLAGRLPTVTQSNFQTVGALMTVMNATGNQGLMGSRGEALIGGLDTWIQGKGGGATKNLIFAAMQQQAAREGRAPLDLRGLELSSEEGAGSAFNLRAVANMFGPGGMAPGGAMSGVLMKYLGITGSVHQAEAFLPALQAVAAGAGGGFEAVSGAMGKSGINNAAMPFAVRILAGTEKISTVLDDFASMMSPSERGAFQKQAAGVTDPQKAVELLGQFGDKTDRLLTQQDKATLSMTDFSNSLVDLATKMLPAVTGSLYAMTGIVNILGGGLAALNGVVDMAAVTFGLVAGVSGLQAGAMGIKGVSGVVNMFSKAPQGPTLPGIPNIGGTSAVGRGVRGLGGLRGVGGAVKAAGPAALLFAALNAYQGISEGQDPTYAVGRSIAGGLGSIVGGILGGAGGSFVMPVAGTAVGAVAGSIGGGIAMDALYTKLFGDGMKIQGDDKLAKDETLKALLEFLKDQKMEADALKAVQNAPTEGAWAPGGRLDESSRGVRATATSVFGHAVTQGFGKTAFNPNHTGIDLDYKYEPFSLPFGTKVLAEGNWDKGLGGNEMQLEGPGGSTIVLAHLKSFVAKVGAMVGAGQTLAITGNTGYDQNTGGPLDPHLHFQVLKPGATNWTTGAIDPISYLNSLNVNVTASPLTIQTSDGRVYQTQLTATYKPSNR